MSTTPSPDSGATPSDALPSAPATEQPTDYVAAETFDQLPLSEPTRRSIAERGYTRPTPVQARALRPALSGRDLIVRSKTGTGKTAAFGIPVIERIDATKGHVQAICLCPTRELAIQVAEEIALLGKHKGVKVTAIYGGASMQKQLDDLQGGAQFVVGTPGRVYDHIRRQTLKLDKALVGVLDEADEMLNQGFFEEVMRILGELPEGRQTLLFSATVTPDIERLIRKFTRDPETILLSGDTYTVEGITNVLYEVEDAYPKPRNLLYLLEKEQPEAAIVFCNTRDDTSLVTAVLNRNGFDAELLNGDLAQSDRERVMAKVKKGELQFMVATDIAARGIDISDLTHVVNYSLPEDPAVYLHRVGRTGRIGRKGTAISLFTGAELSTLTSLEKKYGIKFDKRKMPSAEEAHRLWAHKHLAQLQDAASGSVYDAMIPLARDLKARDNADALVAFLLKSFFTHARAEKLAALAQGGSEVSTPSAPPAAAARKPDRERKPREEKPKEKREKRERRERPATEPGAAAPAVDGAPEPVAAAELAPGKQLFWVNLGATDGLDAAQIQAAIAEVAGIAADAFDLQLRATHSYVATADAAVAEALKNAHGKERNGKVVRIEQPRRKR